MARNAGSILANQYQRWTIGCFELLCDCRRHACLTTRATLRLQPMDAMDTFAEFEGVQVEGAALQPVHAITLTNDVHDVELSH